MRDLVPNSDVLQLISILTKEQRPYHFEFSDGKIFLYLDGIEAELQTKEPPLSDLVNARKPNRWMALTLAWLSLLSFLLFVVVFHQ